MIALVFLRFNLSVLRPVFGAPVHVISVDANSVNATDANVDRSASQPRSFKVGAVINATSANPVSNVFGFQFVINYNASAFVAQGDPDPSATPGNPLGLYVDGAASTVNFGAQTAPGTVNWAGLIAANKGLSDSHDRAAGGKCWFGSLRSQFSVPIQLSRSPRIPYWLTWPSNSSTGLEILRPFQFPTSFSLITPVRS